MASGITRNEADKIIKQYINNVSPSGKVWQIQMTDAGAVNTVQTGGPTGDTTPPIVVSRGTTGPNTIRIGFNEAMEPVSIAGHTFTPGSPSAVTQINSTTYDFTVPTMSYGQSITHSYSPGITSDAGGNLLQAFSNQAVTNNIPNPADVTAPTVPTGLNPTNIAQTSFTLNWGASSDAVGVTLYEVFKGGASIGTSATTSLNITSLSASTGYSMTVRARDAAGNYSAQSTALVVTTSAASAGTFNASSVPGLLAWNDATDDTNTTTDGSGNASQLTDKSGNSRHMVQANSGSRPVRATGGINSKKFIQLTAGASMSIASLADNQPYTIYVVGTHRNNVGTMATMNNAGSVNMMVSNTIYGSELFDYTITLGGGSNQYGRMTNTLRLNTAQIWRFVLDNNSTGIKINREPAYPRNFAGSGTSAIENFTIGGGSVSWDFYEALVYDHHVTDGEHAIVQEYLYGKYPVSNGNYIAFLGDSITEGQSPQFEYQQYTWLVAKELTQTHYNYGISGATLHQAGGNTTKGWDTQVLNAIGEANTGIISSIIGYNNDRNGNEVQWKADYKAGVQQLLNAGYAANKIFLFSPIHALFGHSGTDAQMDAMAADIQAIAAETGTTYGDLLHYSRNRAGSYTMPDTIHPHTAGHRLMADYVKSVIQGSPLSI